MRNTYQNLVRKFKEDHFGDLNIGTKIILKSVLIIIRTECGPNTAGSG
jgi:hypothetical protein